MAANTVLEMREHGGRMKTMPIPNTTEKTLHKLARGNVVSSSAVYTCDNSSYVGSYRRHKVLNYSVKEYVNGMAHTNGIESAWASLKQGLTGTYHNVSINHLPRYVDEFAFRLNEGNYQMDTIDRMEVLAKGFGGKQITYKELKQWAK